MIAKMSKVEIVGQKDRLQDVLAELQDLGVFQLEEEALGSNLHRLLPKSVFMLRRAQHERKKDTISKAIPLAQRLSKGKRGLGNSPFIRYISVNIEDLTPLTSNDKQLQIHV